MQQLGVSQTGRPKKRISYYNHPECRLIEYHFEIKTLVESSSMHGLECISHADSFGLSLHQTSIAVAEHCTVLKSATSLGINCDDISLEESSINAPELFFRIKPTNERPKINGSSIVLLNQFGPNYFHTLIETAARLRIIANSIGFSESIQFLVDGPVSGWHSSLVEALLRPFRRKEVLYIDAGQYYHPGPLYITPTRQPVAFSAQHGKLYLQEHVIGHCLDNKSIQAASHTRLVYVRRDAQGQRSLLNQAEVEELVIKFGGKIVDSEMITLEEQWSTVASASIMIGVHGAGLANMVLMKKGTVVFELSNQNWRSDLYPVMALSLGLRHSFIDCTPIEHYGKNARLYLDITKLKRLLSLEY